jgi:TatD DNase family protein
MILIDIHTHKDYSGSELITVRNTYPGEGFGAFHSTNYYSVGLHPWHIKSTEENNNMLKQVEQACEFKHVIFIGECGLDKNCGTDFSEQERVFVCQVELAEKRGKPMMIHSVKSYGEILGLRKKLKAKTTWILHSFTGNFEEAKKMANSGFIFSFGNILFNDKARAVETFKNLPLDLIFLETDEFSGSIEEIYIKASELRGIDFSLLAKTIELNFNRITGKV